MNYKKFKFSAILLLGLVLPGVYAQQAITATGGNASGNGGSVSFTIGQVVYTINTGTNGSTAQGVQQPYEISVVTGLEETNGTNFICSAYPNPAANYILLKIENYKTENLTYQLYDNIGRLLQNNRVQGNVTNIDMCNMVIATYFLKVIESNNVLKIFKIVKN